MQKHYDMIIIGGGLVGASLACALAKLPLKIAVVDANAQLQQATSSLLDTRTVVLTLSSQRILAGIGVWQQLAGQVTPIKQIHVSDKGRFGSTRLSASDVSMPALGYVVENQSLLQALYHTINKSTIELICPATISAINLDNDKAEIEIETNNVISSLSADLVVAADGGNSKARSLLNIATTQWDYQQTAVVANIIVAKEKMHVSFERFTSSGPLAMLPIGGQCYALVWSLKPAQVEEVMALNDKEFLQRLQQQFGYRLGKLLQTSKRYAFPLTMTFAQEQVKPHFVLLGNAAHTLHPVAGQGFNLALRDVAELAELLASNKSIGDLNVLQTYADTRLQEQKRLIRATDGMVRIFSNDFFLPSHLRKLGIIGFDRIPVAKQALSRFAMGLQGRLSKLARGLEL